jgi:hypothetical protein
VPTNGYASGGFTNGEHLYVAGEQGGEFIWPSYEPYLSKYANALAGKLGGGAGVGGQTAVYVTVQSADDDPYETGRRIGEATALELKMRGVSA